jgi:hypothetical protein
MQIQVPSPRYPNPGQTLDYHYLKFIRQLIQALTGSSGLTYGVSYGASPCGVIRAK